MTHQPEPHLPGVLAIDAGNSKTDVALIGADGSVLGSARGGGFTPQKTGGAAAVAGLAPWSSRPPPRPGSPPGTAR